MKLLKLAPIAALLLTATTQASTVSVSNGFGGVNVTETGLASDGYTLAVGGWDGAVFTQFGNALSNITGPMAGNISGDGPASLDAGQVFLYVGSGPNVSFASDIGWAVFGTNANFPSPIGSALESSTLLVDTTAALTSREAGNDVGSAITDANTVNLVTVVVPEPSVALLGALGVLGLVRRRR